MNNQFTTLALYFWPLLGQVALSFLVAALILVTRVSDLAFGSGTVKFYENYIGIGGPVLVQRTTNQLANLFEFPILFFALVCILVSVNTVDPMIQAGAWIFVGCRWVHALIHLFVNMLWIRMPVFMMSNIVLFAMWVRLAYLVYSHVQ